MHIAILVTNTDESEFADHHPKDREKFTTLIHAVRPEWELSVFEVKDDKFPHDIAPFDGLIITGSPASIHENANWIDRLRSLIIEAHQAGQKMFGACFGHQAIAEALGGAVGENPTGWVLGTVEAERVARTEWETHLPDKINLYAAHHEQVLRLPEGAQVIHRQETCQNAGFRIGNSVYATQYHPEMKHEFVIALTEEMKGSVPDEVIESSYKSLAVRSEYLEFAESIARFFEHS